MKHSLHESGCDGGRRRVLGLLAAGVVAVAGLSIGLPVLADEPGQVKVVYHVVDGLDQASRALANIRNHLKADPSVKIVVVALGDGIKFLLDGAKDRNGRPYDAMVAALVAQGVEFRICNNTLQAHGVPASQVILEAKVVDSGVAEIARLQAKEGYVYLRP
jgi:intracellular sulfur oxidation DsrE/DsrF family protein